MFNANEFKSILLKREKKCLSVVIGTIITGEKKTLIEKKTIYTIPANNFT